MNSGVPGRLLRAFIVGGAIGLLSELFFVLWTGVFGAGSMWCTPATLLTLGICGGLLFVFGIYQKIERFAGMGAVFPFSGLASAIAASFAAGREKSIGAGVKEAVKFAAYVLGIGSLLSILTATVVFLIG